MMAATYKSNQAHPADGLAPKDPDATIAVVFDWSDYLGADTISTSTWSIPAGLTQGSDSNTTTTATVTISGGTAGNTYTIRNRIVTAGGTTDDRSAYVRIAER